MPDDLARSIRPKLLRWYDAVRRDLPWRPAVGSKSDAVNPYLVLVSEAMLQQTQVATVVPYFRRFIEAFPTIHALAAADEQAVLRHWQGLGYYSRARSLRRAAIEIVNRFGGDIPAEVESLRTLPGVGRYTAGAIASIAFDVRTPIVDGNVARVLCRLEAIRTDPRERETLEKLWTRAAQLVPPKRAGAFNSALMELGATICTPKSPKCLLCPIAKHCRANALGLAESIPPSRRTKSTPTLAFDVLCVRRRGNEFLFQQRPTRGIWAGLWQFATVERRPKPVGARIDSFAHQLTHRRFEFDVFLLDETHAPKLDGEWRTLEQSESLPLPKPHVRVRESLRNHLEQSRPEDEQANRRRRH